MENDKRQREFTTSKGTKIVLLDWITGRESQEINAPMFAQMKMKPTASGTVETGNITMDVATLMDNEAVRIIVKSVNGNTINTLDSVLDLPVDEYNEVMAEVRETLNGKKK